MDKIIVNVNNEAKTGFSVSFGGQTYLLNKSFYEGKSGKMWIYLPMPNPLNRKLVDKALLSDGYEITNTRSPRNLADGAIPHKSDRDYLPEDKQAIYDELMAIIMNNKKIEKYKAEYEKAKAEYEALIGKAE